LFYIINNEMSDISEEELEIVRKYYRLYLDRIPDNKMDIPDFLDSLSTYVQNKDRHFDDELVKDDISTIVDQYFVENGKEIRSFGFSSNSWTITDEEIQKRKDRMIHNIKWARDRYNGPIYFHYVGADSSSEELCRFYYYVYNKYYESIGTSWENR